MTKWVYSFGAGPTGHPRNGPQGPSVRGRGLTTHADGGAEMRVLLGGKGAGLAEMSNLGLPVPPGFTITTEICTHFYANGKTYPADLKAEVGKALADVEALVGRKFGDAGDPLLVSVRSDRKS